MHENTIAHNDNASCKETTPAAILPTKTLAQLKKGERGVVRALLGSGAIQQRLMEMGIGEGVTIDVLRFAPLGDPMMIRVRGFQLALRKSEAALVEVEG
ncbi:MAG TPA: FeoA family protein [Candidatus Hydrogenedentes bacterium]|nr:FeoA family protein [Candidatus Hydrogenedentota bacterium]